MIKAQNLSKTYRSGRKKKLAVDNLSFQVETGKVTGFLGPNGAGKSTTMRLMLGLDRDKGAPPMRGKPLKSYSQPSKIVGILLEAKAFHPTRTPEHHLKILAAAGGIAYSRVGEVLDIVGLTDVATKAPGKFSLGMSQRLGLAAAILGQPKYLMLDEPANGLDPEGIAWLRQFIRDYAAAGNGVLISSHLLSEMSQMADNVIVIGKGKMITDTSVKDLLAKGPSGTFVRSTNLDKLKTALKRAKFAFTAQDGGLAISGIKTDRIGQLAHDADVTVLELSSHGASLEEAFLELTAGAEEYQTRPEAKL